MWQAILIGLFGCLFCAGRGFEEKCENGKSKGNSDTASSPTTDRDTDNGRGHSHSHSHSRHGGRGRRGSRSGGSEVESRGDYSHDGRGDGARGYLDEGYPYGYSNSRGGRDDRVMHIPAVPENERYQPSDDGVRRWVGGEDMYSVDESPQPRRRRVKREVD